MKQFYPSYNEIIMNKLFLKNKIKMQIRLSMSKVILLKEKEN